MSEGISTHAFIAVCKSDAAASDTRGASAAASSTTPLTIAFFGTLMACDADRVKGFAPVRARRIFDSAEFNAEK